MGVSWLPGSRRPYRFRSLIEARIYTGRALLGPKVWSGDNGIVESRETVGVLCACATMLAKGREFSRERRHIQTLGERELYVSFPAFLSLSFAAREKDGKQFDRAVENLWHHNYRCYSRRGFREYRQYQLRQPPSDTVRCVTRATKIDLRCANIL